MNSQFFQRHHSIVSQIPPHLSHELFAPEWFYPAIYKAREYRFELVAEIVIFGRHPQACKQKIPQKPRRKLISLIFFYCSSHSMMCIVSSNRKKNCNAVSGIDLVHYHAWETEGAHVLSHVSVNFDFVNKKPISDWQNISSTLSCSFEWVMSRIKAYLILVYPLPTQFGVK